MNETQIEIVAWLLVIIAVVVSYHIGRLHGERNGADLNFNRGYYFRDSVEKERRMKTGRFKRLEQMELPATNPVK